MAAIICPIRQKISTGGRVGRGGVGALHRGVVKNISLQIWKHVRQLDNLSPRARMACHYHCQRSFASAVDQVFHPMPGKWQRGNLGFGKVFKTGEGERESNSQSSRRDEDGKQPLPYSAHHTFPFFCYIFPANICPSYQLSSPH